MQYSKIQIIFSCPSTYLLSSTPNTHGYIPWTMLPSILPFSLFGCPSIHTELTTSCHRCAVNVSLHYLLGFPVYQSNWFPLTQTLNFVVCIHQWCHSIFCCCPNMLIAMLSNLRLKPYRYKSSDAQWHKLYTRFFFICMMVEANSFPPILLVVYLQCCTIRNHNVFVTRKFWERLQLTKPFPSLKIYNLPIRLFYCVLAHLQ